MNYLTCPIAKEVNLFYFSYLKLLKRTAKMAKEILKVFSILVNRTGNHFRDVEALGYK